MNKLKVASGCCAVVLVLGAMGPSFNGLAVAAEQSQEMKAERKAYQIGLKEGLQETLVMRLLKVYVWKKMTHDSKVAFIWGFGHVVSIEQNLMEKFPELKRESFVAKVVEGMAGMPMDKVVDRIDGYYDAHPDKLETPVTNVIWDIMIKPNIKTGIAGRQL